MSSLEGRNYVITGGASGIGLATARLLQKSGANLVLWDVAGEKLQQAGESLGAETAVVDVTQPDQVEAAMAKAVSRLGSLDGLIHCAGILRSGAFTEIPLAVQRQVVDINLNGSIAVAFTAVPYLQQSKGSLILLASTSAFYGPPEFAAYGASKAGVLSLAQSLRLELEDTGLHIGVVCPFFVSSPMLNDFKDSRMYDQFGAAHTPEEVAQAIVKSLTRRQFMIWPSANPAFFYAVSHLVYPLRHLVLKFLWRRAQKKK